MPERFATLRFHQDHVIALKHHGPTSVENLAWSCADCNAYKGSDLSSIDPKTGKIEHLFNPRQDSWKEHFEWKDEEVRGKTAIGRATVSLLQMNREERVAVRCELMAAGVYPR